MPDVMTPTWFVSRRVRLPLAAAATALDELVDQRRRDGSTGPVALTEGLKVWPADTLPGDARRLDARLRVGALGRPLRVEFELGAWSRVESQVAIRPTRRPRPAARYWEEAADALDALRATLPSLAPPSSPVLARWLKAS